MKLNKIIFSLMAAFSLLAVSCQEEIAYTPGEQDLEGCYGVYFPTQEASGDHTMDPSETPAVDIVVKRATEDGDITVPVDITASEEGIFNVPELKFADGQTEAVLSVTFPNAKPGVDYSLTLEITDPEYASLYGANPTFINYNVVIERYDLMGIATYREDLLTALFEVPNIEWQCEVYTKETTPGVYYFKNLYTSLCPFNEPGDYVEEDVYFTVNAANPGKVYVPAQPLGWDWGYGMAWAGSLCKEAGFNTSDGQYGSLVNGVITFPVKGLLFAMEGYEDMSFFYANPKGLSRIILPGAILVDYTIELEAGYSADGQQPVAFTFGADVATIKYAAFEGPLSKADLEEKTAELAAATDAKTVARPAEDEEGNVPDAVVNFEFEKTGEYTVIAVGCDEAGAAQSTASIVLTYVAADDADGVPVVVSGGLGSAAKYAPQGISSETAVEFYVYGEDLVDVKVGLFSYASLAGDQNACIQALLKSESAPAEVIAEINENVYVDVFTGLTPGTAYYLLVWASNGYEQKLILTDPWTTDGDPLPVYQSFTAADFKAELLPENEEGYFGTYNYYAKGPKGSEGLRSYQGTVTIADCEDMDDLGPDDYGYMDEYLTISGLFPSLKGFGATDDTVVFDCYGGVIYNLVNTFEPVTIQGNTYYPLSAAYDVDGYFYKSGDFALVGAFVDEGYLAFVGDPGAASQGYEFTGIQLIGYADAGYTSAAASLGVYTDILLVDPAVDDNGLAPAPKKSTMSRADLDKVNFNLAADINYVETERGRIRSAIDKMKAEKAVQSVGTIAGVKGEWSAPAAEFTAEEAAPQFKSTTSDFGKVNDAKPALYR